MQQRWIILAGLAVIVLAGLAAVLLLGQPQPTPSNVSEDKGGLIKFTPDTSTPQPTGPVEPTQPPTPRPTSTAIPNPTATTAPVPTGTSRPVSTTTLLPVATPTPQPKGIEPTKIRIPSINVNTFIERVGVAKDGTMDVPKNIWNTAWFGNGGYRPGDAGNAVIAGHLDAPGTKAVFWDLDKVKVGDKIYLTDAQNKELVFQVASTQAYPIDSAPLVTIFGPSEEAHLNLITCSGTFDRTSRNYNKRLVVFSKLVS